jgi:carbonic anhydrase
MSQDSLLERSRALRADYFAGNAELFAALSSEGQFPDALFVGCSDSRVLPEQLTGSKPGDLFVLRAVANVVPPSGTAGDAVGAAIEYAVLHLRVKHIVICGHTDCGGIKALDGHIDQATEPHIARWLALVRPAQTQVDAQGIDPEGRHRAIVEQNVLNQLVNIQTYDPVRRALDANALELHGWVYDLSNGRISYWDADAGRFVDERQA